jgi:hypothetical protein
VNKTSIPRTLDDKTFKWLENRKTLNLPGRPTKDVPEKGLSNLQLKTRRRQKFFRIRETASKEIYDLTKLAELLPEDQLRQVFTTGQLRPLFAAILRPLKRNPEEPSKDEDLLEKKRERLLPVCHQIISLLDDPNFSIQMAGSLRTVTMEEGKSLAGLRAVYYRSTISDVKNRAKKE